MSTVAEHYAVHLAPLYEWMLGDIKVALLRSAAELDAAGVHDVVSGIAIDLGAGIGLHALPLAQRGYSVIAIDSNRELLATLQARTRSLPITCIDADLLDFARHAPQANVMLCMGDTLTHLRSLAEVKQLLASVAQALRPGGKFITTFRDYVTAPLTAERRFIPVRSDARRILTCFVEYADDVVMVHDVLHEWINDQWQQRVSCYPKLRLAPNWVASQLQQHGLVVRITAGMAGMISVVATKPFQ